MDDFLKIKRGETIPLKVNSLATHDEILAAAIKKHGDFNKRFDSEGNYQLVFKDGRRVNFIPGTDPPESFVLQRYKELSGFGFSRIALYLFPDSHSTDSDNESAEENFECTNSVGGQGKCFVRESNRKITYIKQLLNEVE